MTTIAKDTPLAEITLRKYEKLSPECTRREIVRKVCLSMGLLQPGDSRDIVVDVLQAVIDNKKEMSSEEIIEKAIALRKESNLPMNGIASSNIRRQIKRLKDIYFIEKAGEGYRLTENEELVSIFEHKIQKFILPSITERIKEYLNALK
ncbi:MAG: hypothetical protein PHO02_03255 [Candidatus Nanoarchaeia archaeon]|nr:hypothetical protein [Candidatus Nanoarchaeia archaeon]